MDCTRSRANSSRKVIAVTSDKDTDIFGNLNYGPDILTGKDALTRVALESGADLVVLAVDGIAGLKTFAACLEKQDSRWRWPTRNLLVCGGDVVLDMMRETGTQVLPVDSEHSAIFQILNYSYDTSGVKKLMITASGGPFRGKKRSELERRDCPEWRFAIPTGPWVKRSPLTQRPLPT